MVIEITKDSPDADGWRQLLYFWEEERRPGRFTLRGTTYEVRTVESWPVFRPVQGGMNASYDTLSKR